MLDVAVPTDRLDGRPRGFAFVQMATAEQGAAAISRLDGQELDGRVLRVNAAEDKGGGGGGGTRRPEQRFGADRPPAARARPKGSRRNVRSRKRGF